MEIWVGCKFASLLLAALAPIVPVLAQSSGLPPSLTYIPGSSVKLYQINGDCDWAQWDATITSSTPTCKPTTSKTATNADVLGDDVATSFENNGELITDASEDTSSAPLRRSTLPILDSRIRSPGMLTIRSRAAPHSTPKMGSCSISS